MSTNARTAAAPHATLASGLFAGSNAMLRRALLVAAGIGILTASAKINVPMVPVPMTMQTFAVSMIGLAYGARLGAATVIAYLVAAAAGLPIFAGPLPGTAYLLGPTAGFLAGMVPMAYLSGLVAERGLDRSPLKGFLALLLASLPVFLLGWGWLAYGVAQLGAGKAFAVGVAPFILGNLVKCALAAAGAVAGWSLIERFRG